MARGKKFNNKNNSRKRKLSNKFGGNSKPKRKSFKRGNDERVTENELHEGDNQRYKKIKESDLEAESEEQRGESLSEDEEVETKTALDELITMFNGDNNSNKSDSDEDSEPEENVENEYSDDLSSEAIESEDNNDDDDETTEDKDETDYLKEHFEKEIQEEKISQVLTKKNVLKPSEVNLGKNLGFGKYFSTCVDTKLQFPISNNNSSAKDSFIDNEMYALISTYVDFLHSCRDSVEVDKLTATICHHVTRHILKTRSKIIHHNYKLKRKKPTDDKEYRDQGLTRPKVLILIPFRSSAMRYVDRFSSHFEDANATVMNKKRFQNEFGSTKPETKENSKKPEDHLKMFSGNTDDNFRLGISMKKNLLRLYAPFYSSDILLASPLGLRMAISEDHDFLSSIEILVVDQPEVMMMQNWEHVLFIGSHLNLEPKKSHGVDFSRVRFWSLEKDWSKCYRQNLVFSSFISSELMAFFNRFCFNYAGFITLKSTDDVGDIKRVALQLTQTFQRFQVNTPKEDADERFKFFTETVLPQFKSPVMNGTLIFIPSYFDFVRLRNFFRSRDDLSYVQICEYQEPGKTAEARDKFFHRHRKFLLYTERTHFYKRYIIKGIKNIIFYQLPLIPRFYSEMCNLLQLRLKNDDNPTCSVVLSRYDSYRLAAVVGTSKAAKLLSSTNKVHLFISGEV